MPEELIVDVRGDAIPPFLAKVLAYSSVRNERQTLSAPLPPNGPSPSKPVNICWNIELRNIASNFSDAVFALAFMIAVGSCVA
jgi:hypothetical protein